ncbi:MAG: hypothetical protein EOO90_01825 [Pedobacter sp.]|nr:MAG: hypothetical protein EOO90_01825 [Pedobacter sp.]
MKEEKDYIGDIVAIRSMMERSSKFLSFSGWAGIMAGIYALVGAWIANSVFHFEPVLLTSSSDFSGGNAFAEFFPLIWLAAGVLVLSLGTAILLSYRKASKKNETVWNNTSKRMLVSMAVPLVSGGLLALIMISHGLTGMVIPITLIFYGLSLYNAGKFTYAEIRVLGLMQIVLGLIAAYFVIYALLLWALGFGILNIITGVYTHIKYEK